MAVDTSPDVQVKSWQDSCRAAVHPRVIAMFFLGISAGLPLLLIFSSLSVWLREAGVERATVTFFSWAALAYSFKFVWAPLVDKLPVPFLTRRLGRRRGWLLLAQLMIMASIGTMALTDPAYSLVAMALATIALGFSSATQDIVIDAYRIEAVSTDLQAMMSASYIAGYRVGMLAAGAGALFLAQWAAAPDLAYDYQSWRVAYGAMALVMLAGVATTLVIREPDTYRPENSAFGDTGMNIRFLGGLVLAAGAFAGGFVGLGQAVAALGNQGPLVGFVLEILRFGGAIAGAVAVGIVLVRSTFLDGTMLREGYVAPLMDFVVRYGKLALLILALVGFYRVSDIVMGVIANVFYVDMGFTKDQIATYAKTYGLFATIAGGFLGGILALRFGVLKILFAGAILVAATNALFAVLALSGPDTFLFAGVIIADNLSGGIASAAFVAYLSSLTSVSFTAMQYALFSSLMTLFPKVIGGYSGMMVDTMGYPGFFLMAAGMGIPVLVLVWAVARYVPLKDS